MEVSSVHYKLWTVLVLLTVTVFQPVTGYSQSELERLRRGSARALEDARKTTQKALEDARKTTEKALEDARKVTEKALEDARKTSEKALSDFLDGGDHLGNEICKEICKVGCGGSPSCTCSCSGGVATNEKGEVKGYDPGSGETQSGPPEKKPELEQLHAFQASLDPRGMWWFEHNPLRRAWTLHRDNVSTAVPSSVIRFHMPVKDGVLRTPGPDDAAGGLFWSPRYDKSFPDGRLHAGFDVLNVAGSPVYAPISGIVVRPSNPGKPGLTGLMIKQDAGSGRSVSAVVWYVQVDERILQQLNRNPPQPVLVEGGVTVIGTAQNITTPTAYGAAMKQHLHVSLFDHSGNHVALDEKLQRIVTDVVIRDPKRKPEPLGTRK